jgi:hypothetical protein
VNVTDANHGYATPASGEPVLQSAETGPIRILYKPAGTGEKTCAVLFAIAGQEKKRLCRFTLDAALAVSDASVEATIASQYGDGVAHASNDITVYNLLTHTAGTYVFEADSGDAGLAYYDSGTSWRILNMECP